jgi:wyosine [tRNA(Phe)-imidazoG37] synthetase (radical SAM superfamily)
MENIVFGPVPSRRLGRSIGVNNIPYKVCSYSCAYCQIGKAGKHQFERVGFYSPVAIIEQVKQKIKSLNANEMPDYITIVPDGEPTLDIHLGELIQGLKVFGIPVAVITNSSLIDNLAVQEALMSANYVSLKIDTVVEQTWKNLNKPHKKLKLDTILRGIEQFAKSYSGILVTESMFVKNINNSAIEIDLLAHYLCNINPMVAYIAIPTRPPAFEGIEAAGETTIAEAYHVFQEEGLRSELLTGYEGDAFASSGNFIQDLLSITAVHPMRNDAVMKLMLQTNETEEVLNRLITEGQIQKIHFQNQDYFLRKFSKKQQR